MTTPPKTMAEIRDAEAEKHGRFKFIPGVNKAIIEDFKAGFDCRDKLGPALGRRGHYPAFRVDRLVCDDKNL